MNNSKRTTSAQRRPTAKRIANNEDINLVNYDPLLTSIDKLKHSNG